MDGHPSAYQLGITLLLDGDLLKSGSRVASGIVRSEAIAKSLTNMLMIFKLNEWQEVKSSKMFDLLCAINV